MYVRIVFIPYDMICMYTIYIYTYKIQYNKIGMNTVKYKTMYKCTMKFNMYVNDTI